MELDWGGNLPRAIGEGSWAAHQGFGDRKSKKREKKKKK